MQFKETRLGKFVQIQTFSAEQIPQHDFRIPSFNFNAAVRTSA